MPGMTLKQAMGVFVEAVIAPNRQLLHKIWRNDGIAIALYRPGDVGKESHATLKAMKWNGRDVVFQMPKKAIDAFLTAKHGGVDDPFKRWLKRSFAPAGRVWMFASHGNFLINVDLKTEICSVEPGSTDYELGLDPKIPQSFQPMPPPPHIYESLEHGRYGFALGRKRSD